MAKARQIIKNIAIGMTLIQLSGCAAEIGDEQGGSQESALSTATYWGGKKNYHVPAGKCTSTHKRGPGIWQQFCVTSLDDAHDTEAAMIFTVTGTGGHDIAVNKMEISDASKVLSVINPTNCRKKYIPGATKTENQIAICLLDVSDIGGTPGHRFIRAYANVDGVPFPHDTPLF